MITVCSGEVEPAKTAEKERTVMDQENQKVWHLGQSRVKKVFQKGVRGQLHQILLEIEQDGLDD